MSRLYSILLYGLSLVAIVAFFCGVAYVSLPRAILTWKTKAHHYDQDHSKRVENRTFGLQLITVAGLMSAFLFSAHNYNLNRQEFVMWNKPILRLEPVELADKKHYEIIPLGPGKGIDVSVKARVINEGPITAHGIKVSMVLGFGTVPSSPTPTNDDRELTIFPRGT